MLSKRIIPCLDVREGKTTKGIKFKDNIDIGDPVEISLKIILILVILLKWLVFIMKQVQMK